MRRLLLAGAVAASAAFAPAPASALGCPAGTSPRTLPTGTGYCVPTTTPCDPGPCRPVVSCPTDIPVWSSTCRQIFGG